MLDHGLAFDRLERAVRLTGSEPALLAFLADLRRSQAVVTLEHLGVDPLDDHRRLFRVVIGDRSTTYSSLLEGALPLFILLRDGAILTSAVADTHGAARKRLQRAANELGNHCPTLDPELSRVRLAGPRFVWNPSPFAPRVITSDAEVTRPGFAASDDRTIEIEGRLREPSRDHCRALGASAPGS